MLAYFRWMMHNMGRKKVLFITGYALNVVATLLSFAAPIILGLVVNNVLIGVQVNGETVRRPDLLPQYILAIMSFVLLRAGLAYLRDICLEKATQEMVYNLRVRLYDNIQRQGRAFFIQNRTGDLMTRLTSDLDQIRHTAAWVLVQMLACIVQFGGTLIYLLTRDWLLTLALLAVSPVICFVSIYFAKKTRPLFADQREKLSDMSAVAQENIAGNRVVKAFAREDYEIGRFLEHSEKFRRANLKVAYMWEYRWPIINFLCQVLSVITLVLGGVFVMMERIDLGTLTVFISMSANLSTPLRMLGMMMNNLQRFNASAPKVMELYESSQIVPQENGGTVSGRPMEGRITLDRVSLELGGHPILQEVTFELEAGKTLAIMGDVGSGKSMLAALFTRMYDPTGGVLSIDGVPIEQWSLEDLRRHIGVASQKVFLFSNTVDSNIAYGDSDLSDEDVRFWAEQTDCEFVKDLSEGFETVIGERGVGLSGGQKQRIALARALAIQPSILIMDDTTSAVDMETEVYIRDHLNHLPFPCTKIIIAQRTSVAQTADQILVLDHGRVAEFGTHEQLLAQNGYYRSVYDLQNGLTDESEGGEG